MYSERRSVIRHAVVWTAAAPQPTEQHVLPDGCIDLLWHDNTLLVAGPDTQSHATTWTPHRWTGLRFAFGVGRRVIGVPAHEIRDQRVPLDALLPARESRLLHEQVANSPDPGAALERLALERLEDYAPGLTETMFDLLRKGTSVSAAAGHLGLSPRQFHRRSLDSFGYGPKTLARILRFNRALELARTDWRLADAALASGYSDQAHFARDARDLTGRTLTSLLA